MTIPLPILPVLGVVTTRIGVLRYDTTVNVDAILRAAVDLIRARGIAVGGLLQRTGERLPNGRHMMWVNDIATGRTIRLDQPRGSGATACVLDPDALAQAACLLRKSIETEAGLIVVNRFGHAEAEGRGLRAEIAAAICSGAAVLMAVRNRYLTELEDFLGAPASLLPASALLIADWVEQATTLRQADRAAQSGGA